MCIEKSFKKKDKIIKTLKPYYSINKDSTIFESQTFDVNFWFFFRLSVFILNLVMSSRWVIKSNKKEEKNIGALNIKNTETSL